jgi:hypothetical protein
MAFGVYHPIMDPIMLRKCLSHGIYHRILLNSTLYVYWYTYTTYAADVSANSYMHYVALDALERWVVLPALPISYGISRASRALTLWSHSSMLIA